MKIIGIILLLYSSAFMTSSAAAENVVPVIDISPEYPQSALRREASGYVVVRFEVNEESGKAQNITIVEANPERIFNSSVKTALRRSIFELKDGSVSNSVERVYHFDHSTDSNMTNRFNFMEEAPQVALK